MWPRKVTEKEVFLGKIQKYQLNSRKFKNFQMNLKKKYDLTTLGKFSVGRMSWVGLGKDILWGKKYQHFQES